MAPSLQLAYYADDFTGATDALEWLERAGVRTALFLRVPDANLLARMPAFHAIGVAGRTRALPTDELEVELRRDFVALRALRPRHVHYKVCSTFDSSPAVGSIGRAIEVGADVFGAACIPVVGGAPALGRYCVFGHVFAQDGIGSDRAVHRLDRHPVMSRHPVTPADESDLRRHLARQTRRAISLIDLRQLDGDTARLAEAWRTQRGVVLLDTLTRAHVARIGELLERAADAAAPLLTIGPSSVEQALGDAWAERGGLRAPDEWPPPRATRALLVVSGSCSTVTERQVEWARSAGFGEVALSPAGLAGPEGEQVVQQAIRVVTDHLFQRRHVMVHTLGMGRDPAAAAPEQIGRVLGRIATAAVEQVGIFRLLIAGGDTSGVVARALGIEALEFLAPLNPGAPLCRVRAPHRPVDGLEVVVKGGQVGPDDYFQRVAEGLS